MGYEIQLHLVQKMATYPQFETLLHCADPKDVMRAKRSVLSIFSLCAKAFLSAAVVIAINAAFNGSLRLSAVWAALPDISLRWLAIFPALLFLNVIREYHDDIYIFGLHGITQHQGRLSLNKRVPHVKYSDIQSLRVRQDPWGRVFNYGDVDLDTAADAGVEMIIEGVSSPIELSKLIDRLRLYSLRTGMADHETEVETVTDILRSRS
jgi:membrane protein YdbS with pleckstrin-like domain